MDLISLFISIAFLISCFIFLKSKSKSKGMNLPPSPPGWPVIGNLFQVTGSGKPFYQYINDLRPKYGPIFTLKMGTRTLIVVSSGDLFHEALVEKSQVFASRPRETPTRNIFSSDKFTVNSAVYGPIWRSLRRNMVQNVLNPTRVKGFSSVRKNATDRLITRLKTESEANGGAVWVLRSARYAFFCILLAMCFGYEMDEDEITRIDDMMKTVLLTTVPRIDDFLPIFTLFYLKERKRALQVRKSQIELLTPIIEKRRLSLQNVGTKESSFSYLDSLFDLKIEGRKYPPTTEEIVTLCSEFLNGGTDTTGTAIEWGIARVIENPDMQSKIYDEIKSTVGGKKVDEKDVEKMPYLHAFVKELLRKHPPTFISLTHAAIEPATLGGYDIPIDANVELYLPGVAEDPVIWSEPERFDPARFLTGGKEETVDITGVKGGIKMMPFGVGRRICPGLNMATMHVHLILARMVQEFEWRAYPENGNVDLSLGFEFTVVMKNTLRALIKPRV